MFAAPPLSLYVHLPWCVRKCPYCDFNSHAAPQEIPQRSYIDALLGDLEIDRFEIEDRAITTIFFGGGTPSLFDPEEIGRFLQAVRSQVRVAPEAEITLEANPGTIEHGRFAGYKDAGINRVSLGAQTFDPAQLRILGRIHSEHDIPRAIVELTLAGIENFNIDLMYALPQQSVQAAVHDVECAIALAPTHLSHYQLTLEPGTVFYHRPPSVPDSDMSWEIQQRCQERLSHAGYEQYEVSAYARPHRRCSHNLNYWRFGDYLGLGAGAHGKITSLKRGEVLRTTRVRQPREYLNRAPQDRISELRVVERADLPFEFMLNALRLIEGFAEKDFESHTGLPFMTIRDQIITGQQRGLLETRSGRHLASELGQRFLNDTQALFLPQTLVRGDSGSAVQSWPADASS
jgi:putative oxygen-independent coproporphyrinogen III oxidase